jgi:hypothetical protein
VSPIRRPYRTIMRFGTDPNQVAEIQWYFCQPGALPLGFSTPFVSRDFDAHEIWPEIGEVQFARRRNTPRVGLSPAPGIHAPCGDPAVWARGYQGHVPPNYPRNAFGVMLCCAAPLGTAPVGVLGYIPPVDVDGGAGMGGLEDVPGRIPLERPGGAGMGGLEDVPRGLEEPGGQAAGGAADLVGLVEQLGGQAAGGGEDLPTSMNKAIVQTTTGSATGVSPFVNFFFSPATTAGNLLVYVINFNELTPPAGLTQIYTSLGLEIWIQPNAPSTALQQFASTGAPICGCAFELAGCSPTSPLDQLGALQAATSATADTGVVGPTTAISEIAIAIVNTLAGPDPTSPTGGFAVGPAASQGTRLATFTLTLGAIASPQCTAGYGGAQPWQAIMVTFQ